LSVNLSNFIVRPRLCRDYPTGPSGTGNLCKPRAGAEESPDYQRKGIVTFYNNSKGFGFIRDLESDQRLFFHASDVQEPVKEDNIVSFEKGKGPRGISAINVRLFREQTTLP